MVSENSALTERFRDLLVSGNLQLHYPDVTASSSSSSHLQVTPDGQPYLVRPMIELTMPEPKPEPDSSASNTQTCGGVCYTAPVQRACYYTRRDKRGEVV